MARRFATVPTDKAAGLFYLLRTTQLPTYNENTTDENAWRQCFHVLPDSRKFEIQFDFPYRGSQHWFPEWKQLLDWPRRDPEYDHHAAECREDSLRWEFLDITNGMEQ